MSKREESFSVPLIESKAVDDVIVKNSSNNKPMTIVDAVEELESRGFSCETSSDGSKMIGRLSECRCLLMARMDVFVFVRSIPRSSDLTIDVVESDAMKAKLHAEDLTLGVGCPPFGLSRANLIIVVFLIEGGGGDEEKNDDEEKLDQTVLSRIKAAPDKEWCSVTFLAVRDGGKSGTSHFFENYTPAWGKLLFPEMRYWAGLLTGRQVGKTLPIFGDNLSFLWRTMIRVNFCHTLTITVMSPILGLIYAPKTTVQIVSFFLFITAAMHVVHVQRRRCRKVRPSSDSRWIDDDEMEMSLE